jgi:hypothetical protein
MGNLRIGPYVAFASKFRVAEEVITRSRTASGQVDGTDDLLGMCRVIDIVFDTTWKQPQFDYPPQLDWRDRSRQ